MICRSESAFSREDRQGPRLPLTLERPQIQHLRISEDGVERRAQFVRERGEEFVFQTVRGMCALIRERVVDRERGTTRHILRNRQILFRVVASRFRQHEAHRAKHPGRRHNRYRQIGRQPEGLHEAQPFFIVDALFEELRRNRLDQHRFPGANHLVNRIQGIRTGRIFLLQLACVLYLGWIDVFDDEPPDVARLVDDIDSAPVGNFRDRQLRNGRQRLLVVERL